MSVFLICLSVFGTYLNADGRLKQSYMVWLVSNIGWSIVCYQGCQWSLLTLQIIYGCLSIKGLLKK